MINTNSEFIMEVTDKTKADIKVCYFKLWNVSRFINSLYV